MGRLANKAMQNSIINIVLILALPPRVSEKRSSYGLTLETFPWLIPQLVIQITALALVSVFNNCVHVFLNLVNMFNSILKKFK